MGRAFCIPAVFFLFSAFVLLFIVSISLPYLTAMDITRVHFGDVSTQTGNNTMTQLRVSPLLLSFQSKLTPFCSSVYGIYSLPLFLSQNTHTRSGPTVMISRMATGCAALQVCPPCFSLSSAYHHPGHGYSVTITNSQRNSITIGSSWTTGLAVHPVGTYGVAPYFSSLS